MRSTTISPHRRAISDAGKWTVVSAGTVYRAGNIVEPDDGDVLRQPQAGLGNRRHRAHRDRVVAGDHRGGTRLGGQQGEHRPIAAGGAVVSRPHQRLGIADAGSPECGAIPGQASAGGVVLDGPIVDEGHTLVPKAQQMGHRGVHPGRGVGGYRSDLRVRIPAKEDDREAALDQRDQPRIVGVRVQDDQAVDLLRPNQLVVWVADNVTFNFGFGRLPAGPEGCFCMFNGLADSIWTGSKHQAEAWEWVKFLGSQEAQEIVGSHAAVFPAIPSAAEKAKEAYAAKGIDVSAYLEQAQEPNGTFLFPIADNASQYEAIVKPAMQSIALGQAKAADVLPDLNEEVNDLF
jgi:hypothetical protein